MDNSERIDKFLREEMTAEERETFLSDLRTDKDLCDEAQATAMLIKEMKEEQAKKDEEIIKEVVGAKKKAKIIRMVKWMTSIAAMFVVIFGLYIHFNGIGNEERLSNIDLADKYYRQTPKYSMRGGGDDLEQELDSLFDMVGHSKNMVYTRKRLLNIHENVDSEYVYRANGNDIRIKWYLALAFLKDGKTEKSKELLKSITEDDKGTYLKEYAEKLLKELDKQSKDGN